MPKLTKRTIDATEPQAAEFFIWDESIPGFGVRVMPACATHALACSMIRYAKRCMPSSPRLAMTLPARIPQVNL